jgi:hypothetical protein
MNLRILGGTGAGRESGRIHTLDDPPTEAAPGPEQTCTSTSVRIT